MGQNIGVSRAQQGSGGPLVANQAGELGEVIVGSVHGLLAEATLAGRSMMGASAAARTLSAALATTYVGLCLSNPAGSGKLLILNRVSGLLEVAPAALTAIGLITGWAAGGITVHTTPETPVNAFLHDVAAPPVAKLDGACTLVGTPAWSRWLKITPGATAVLDLDADIQGAIVIPPGGYVAIGSSIAGPAAGFLGSMHWEEVVIPAA